MRRKARRHAAEKQLMRQAETRGASPPACGVLAVLLALLGETAEDVWHVWRCGNWIDANGILSSRARDLLGRLFVQITCLYYESPSRSETMFDFIQSLLQFMAIHAKTKRASRYGKKAVARLLAVERMRRGGGEAEDADGAGAGTGRKIAQDAPGRSRGMDGRHAPRGRNRARTAGNVGAVPRPVAAGPGRGGRHTTRKRKQ